MKKFSIIFPAFVLAFLAGLAGFYYFWFYVPIGGICSQVITSGRNPLTGEVKEFGSPCAMPRGWVPVQKVPLENGRSEDSDLQNLIVVDNPRLGQKISSPMQLNGKARGYWFFEASFPVELQDDDGEVIGRAVAQAQGEWMTEEFVPFKAELVFSKPKTQKGKLIFHKDNPSGLPEKAKKLEILVEF